MRAGDRSAKSSPHDSRADGDCFQAIRLSNAKLFDGGFRSLRKTAVALVLGDPHPAGAPPRPQFHSECFYTGRGGWESLRCDLRRAGWTMAFPCEFANEGRGLVIYEHQEGTRHRPDGEAPGLRVAGPRFGHRSRPTTCWGSAPITEITNCPSPSYEGLGADRVFACLSNNPDKTPCPSLTRHRGWSPGFPVKFRAEHTLFWLSARPRSKKLGQRAQPPARVTTRPDGWRVSKFLPGIDEGGSTS